MLLLPQPRTITLRQGTAAGSSSRFIADNSIPHPQGYRLSINTSRIDIAASSPAGRFYAEQTLKQIRRQYPAALPCVEIEDQPDFPTRGVMLDISRDKVPTMGTLFALVDMLAEWKINQLQLYTEHTFAYAQHQTVWKNASPMTGQEIQLLDRYCRERFIDLVPNQNSFGHMERWLGHEQYAHLAESIAGAQTPWGFYRKGPFSICPTDPDSMELLQGLYAELLPNFSSSFFNVGCDETYDIGQGRSKAECDRIGVHRVYLRFIDQVNQLVQSHGRQMMFWGDVILHQPELIAELPKNVIALQWGYEANHPFDAEGEKFQQAGVPFYVCPGTSSWNSITGRATNAVDNLRSAAQSGLRHGAIGYLITDWGDNGHLQYQPFSYPGFAAGAALSWCLQSNINLDIAAVLNLHAFKKPGSPLGQAIVDLGNIYLACGKSYVNGSALFRLLVVPPNDPEPEKGMSEAGFSLAEAEIHRAMSKLHNFETDSDELRLISDECRNAANLLLHCIEIGRNRLGLKANYGSSIKELIAEHQRLWLERNRQGGLVDSVERLHHTPEFASAKSTYPSATS